LLLPLILHLSIAQPLQVTITLRLHGPVVAVVTPVVLIAL
jgi:hypothetical protein